MELNWRVRGVVMITLTREIAKHWLAEHNQINRRERDSVVAQYVEDLKSGRWRTAEAMIIFDWNGQLMNGQHRCEAVSACGIPIEVVVMTGVDPSDRSVMDTHAKRSLEDAFVLSGRAHRIKGGSAPNTSAAVWQRMMDGIANIKGVHSRSEIIDFSDRYAEAGQWALEEFAKYPRVKAVHVAGVIAAVARASYYLPTERLAAFVRVLCTGIPTTPNDETAIKWGRLLMDGKLKGNSNRMAEIYGKTCKAIIAFCREKNIDKFYSPSEEPFPLPESPSDACAESVNRVPRDVAERESSGATIAAMATTPSPALFRH